MKPRNISKVMALVLALALMLSLVACGGNAPASSGSSGESKTESSQSSTGGTSSEGEPSGGEEEEYFFTKDNKSAGPDDTSEPYSFTCYANYDWWSVKPWGGEAASQYMKEKFNVDVEWQKPDADASAKLNLMMSSGDLPDAMVMDRNADLLKVARNGLLVDLSTVKYDGCSYNEDIPEATQRLLAIDGKLYSVPNWPRKAATGGNYSWIVNYYTWEAVGSPELKTFEDIHDYLVAVKDAKMQTPGSKEDITYPFLTNNNADAYYVIEAMYRSLGAPRIVESYFVQENDKIEYCLRGEDYLEALKMANQWYLEGLWSEATLTDSGDQRDEKLANGKFGIAYYDFSQDDNVNFRKMYREKTGSTLEILTDPIFPVVTGRGDAYGDNDGTVGWNVNIITTKAENPQRIFDLWAWQLTKEGSINMMYGPQGNNWDELDENGNPILKKTEGELTTAEVEALGTWVWTQPAHSDNVDTTKFAINGALPEDKQNWTVKNQANYFSSGYHNMDWSNCTPGMKFITDELTCISDVIDPQSDIGIARQTIIDESKAKLPLICMAKDEAEFNKLVEDLLAFVEAQGVAEIEKAYTEKRNANIETQGYTAYQKYYEAKGLR